MACFFASPGQQQRLPGARFAFDEQDLALLRAVQQAEDRLELLPASPPSGWPRLVHSGQPQHPPDRSAIMTHQAADPGVSLVKRSVEPRAGRFTQLHVAATVCRVCPGPEGRVDTSARTPHPVRPVKELGRTVCGDPLHGQGLVRTG